MSNPNDPAYPTDRRISENYMDSGGYGRRREVILNQGGMTIRQRFVLAAMQGLCANPTLVRSATGSAEWIAAEAVRLADAALAEEARTRSKA